LSGLFSRPVILGAAAIAVAAVGYFFVNGMSSDGADLDIETAEVSTGNIRRTVSTSGAVSAISTVDVGSQVSGQIIRLHADYNSVVRAGDLMAEIDPESFETRVEDARLALQSAEDQLALQEVQVDRARSDLTRAEREFARNTELHDRGTISDAAYDQAQSTVESARISVRSAETQLRNATTSVGQRQAALREAEIDLERTTIRAPIDGTVLARLVDQGQTVNANQSVPTLFTLVGSLERVQIEAQVDEADIGQVEDGQTVTFSVDAYSDRQFSGEVVQKRLEPKTESNIVTYTVVIHADNPREMLLPGMTANLDIITGARQNVLTVDNRALRFEPRGPAEAILSAQGRELLERQRQQSQGGGFPGGVVIVGRPGGGNFRGGGERNGGNPMVEQLTRDLDLTAAQAREVQTAMQSVFQSMQQGGGPGGGGGFDREAMQTRMQAAISEVLTPEQAERFAEMESLFGGGRGGRRGTVWVRNAAGQLEPRQVMLGVADTSVTEIVGGNLEEGEQVILRVRESLG
jgi:HlyD family secretion protein